MIQISAIAWTNAGLCLQQKLINRQESAWLERRHLQASQLLLPLNDCAVLLLAFDISEEDGSQNRDSSSVDGQVLQRLLERWCPFSSCRTRILIDSRCSAHRGGQGRMNRQPTFQGSYQPPRDDKQAHESTSAEPSGQQQAQQPVFQFLRMKLRILPAPLTASASPNRGT